MLLLSPSFDFQLVVTWHSHTTGNSSYTSAIDILGDCSLLNMVFHLYWLPGFLLGEDDNDGAHLFGRFEWWKCRHWWYKLVRVVQRWQNLILGLASHLGLCLICTEGTPIADMLAHSPALPLVASYYYEGLDVNAKDKDRLMLAFKQCDRVHRIHLSMNITNLQRLIVAISGECPILKCLIIIIPDRQPSLTLPESL